MKYSLSNLQKINWFPGHMHSTIKAIMNIPKIDLIIEIVDARAINISGNSNLSQYFPNKKKIIIALKTDLADLINVKNPSNVYFCNIHEKNFRQKIISELNKIFQPDFKKFKLKNFYKPQFHILIVGLPNVGKSSFIKALWNRSPIISNKPGTTKKISLLKINDNFFIYDTPGVMPKEIKTFKDGYVLSLINCINNDILPLHEIVNYLFLYCKDKYFKKMSDIFHINQQTDFETFIKNICRQYSFLRKNNEYDEPRAIKYIFDKFTNSYFFKINYEK